MCMSRIDPIHRLTEPVVVSLGHSDWVPPKRKQMEAEAKWAEMCRHNDQLFDGRMVHIEDVRLTPTGGALLRGSPCQYRWYAVQSVGESADLELDCGCRPLGVKGVSHCNGLVLMGRRAEWTTSYAGQWELAPSGGVEPGSSPESALAAEYAEEIGRVLLEPPMTIGLLFDGGTRTWEVVLRHELPSTEIGVHTGEYDAFEWRCPTAPPQDTTPVAKRILQLLIQK